MKMKWVTGLILLTIFSGGSLWAQESQKPLTLEESIKIALERSLTIHSSKEGIVASEFRRKETITNFLPLWTGQYSWTEYNQPITVGPSAVTVPSGVLPTVAPTNTSKDVWNVNSTISQPIFTGGLNSATYRFARAGVNLSKESLNQAKLDLVLQVRVGYFNILNARKLMEVAQQQVKQFEDQLEVSKAFFEVGIVAKNDVLLAEVNVANARQSLITAENNLFLAKSSFNNLLRREINTPLEVVDILEYKPFPLKFEDSLGEALSQRPEIKAAQLNIDQAKENVKIAKSGFFPTLNLVGNYTRFSSDFGPYGDTHRERWTIQTVASFTLWNWGNTAFKVGENKVYVTQAEDSKTKLVESITLEVKNDYLNLVVSEKNIKVSQTAIEQAEENLRMNEERYKYQVATATDVTIAVTLLTQARVNYYSALSNFNVSKATLERAMGRMYP
jgi:outer membrane protein